MVTTTTALKTNPTVTTIAPFPTRGVIIQSSTDVNGGGPTSATHSVDNATGTAVTSSNGTEVPVTTAFYSTSVSSEAHTTPTPEDPGTLSKQTIIAIAVGCAILVIAFVVICVIVMCRKRRKSLPPPLPRLKPNGLPREDSSSAVVSIRYQVWASGASLDPQTPDILFGEDDVVKNTDENHAPSHNGDDVDPGHEGSGDDDVYVNVEKSRVVSDTGTYITPLGYRPDSTLTTTAPGSKSRVVSDTGTYITPLNYRPDSTLTTAAPGSKSRVISDTGSYITPLSYRPDSTLTSAIPGFNDHRLSPCSRGESTYIAMGSTVIAEEQEDLEGIYTPPDEGESEPVYSAPHEPPAPCLSSGRWPYVNIPELDVGSQQRQAPEQGDGSREEEYINLSSPRHIYCNFFQDRLPSKKSKVTRSESLKTMGTRSCATEGGVSRSRLPSCSADKERGVSFKLHKAASMSQVPLYFSSKPRIDRRIPDQILDYSSGSDSERENYENLKDSQAHYGNVQDCKAELDSKRKLSNITSAEQTPIAESKLETMNSKPAHTGDKLATINTGTGTNHPNDHGTKLGGVRNLFKCNDEDQRNVDNQTQGVRNKVRNLNSKQEIGGGSQPRTDSNKPEKVSNKSGILSESKMTEIKAGTVGSSKPGSVDTKPGAVSGIPRSVSTKPETAAKGSGSTEKMAEGAGTKPGTVSGIPRSVGTTQGKAGLKPGSVSIKPGFLSGKLGVSSKPSKSVSSKPGGVSSNPGGASSKVGGAQPGVKQGENAKKGQKPEHGHTNELMQVLAKRRHDNGES